MRLDACSAVRRNVLEELGQFGKWTDEIDAKICDHVTSQGALAYELFVLEQGTAEVVQGDDHKWKAAHLEWQSMPGAKLWVGTRGPPASDGLSGDDGLRGASGSFSRH